MSEEDEYRCFIGNLSWSTSDRGLKDAFEKFGHLVDAKVRMVDFLGCFPIGQFVNGFSFASLFFSFFVVFSVLLLG